MKHIHGGDIYKNQVMLDYSANINPLGMPINVIEGIKDSIHSATHYPDIECRKLRKAIESKEDIPMEYIICGNGAADLIFSICHATKPKKALLIGPTFAEYEQGLRSIDCEIYYYILTHDNGFSLEKDYLTYINEDIDIIFLCNPNNPVGNLIDKEMLISIVEKCRQNNITIVLDECFIDFIEESDSYSMKVYLSTYHNLVILKAFTKFFGMPGIRLGYAMTYNNNLLYKLKEVTQPWNVSTIAQTAGTISCFENEYMEETIKLINKERNFLMEELKKGLVHTVFDSWSNFIFLKADDFIYDRLKEKGIYIRDCSNYIGLEKGYYRIAVKNHEDNIKLINEWRRILESY